VRESGGDVGHFIHAQYLIIEAIGDAWQDYITEEILHCVADDDKLQDAKIWLNYTLSTYSASVSLKLASSEHCSPILNCLHFSQSARIRERHRRHHITPAAIPLKTKGFSTLPLLIQLLKAIQRRKNWSVFLFQMGKIAQAFAKALRCDSYRGMVTREFETKYLESLPLAEQAIHWQAGTGAVPTNLAHMFPPSTLEAPRKKTTPRFPSTQPSIPWVTDPCFCIRLITRAPSGLLSTLSLTSTFWTNSTGTRFISFPTS